MQDKKRTVETKMVHSEYKAPDDFEAFPPAVYRASTIFFPDVESLRERRWQEKAFYTYGTHGTPTTYTLEGRLAEIENADYCRVVPSGLSALTVVNFAFLQAGDDVLMPENIYSPNREFVEWLEKRFQITARFYRPMIGADIEKEIKPNTKLIWVEAPGSVSMEVEDIPLISEIAHRHNLIVALDNTWSAGIYYDGFAHGADVIVQALTKYQSGGGDVLMGAVLTKDRVLNKKIEFAHMILGLSVGADDVNLVLRNLPSLKVRIDAHGASALAIAKWLRDRPEIDKVLHPAFEDCPGHAIWKRDFTGASGLFSVIFKPEYTEAQIDAFVNQLQLFKIGYSWGGPVSLCLPYRMNEMRDTWAHKGQLVRFNIGFENTEELIQDIAQSLSGWTR